jgi:tetratricopeptide (TPR) repeat protein
MAAEDLSKFRKRVEADSGGLERTEGKPAASGGGVAFEKFDSSDRAGSLAIASIADKIRPVEDAALALPDFGIGLLVSQQQSERVWELLERAGALISSREYRSALPVIEEALAADRTSGEAWALKGRCLSQLGYHEAALRVLHYARDQVSEPEIRVVILKLEADCVHSFTRALEEKMVALAATNQLAEALELVRQGLSREPSNIVLLYHQANLHWLLGDNDAARQGIEEAYRHVGRDSVDLIAELERKLEFGTHWSAMEAARVAVRSGDSATAFNHLDSCASALRGNEQYAGLRGYAERKRRTLGQLMGSRGAVASVSVQQQIMRWVLTEELREADDSLRTGVYSQARKVLERAAKLEPDCCAVCYRHARALFLIWRDILEKQGRVDLRNAGDDLKAAEALARRANVDPGYREQADALLRDLGILRGRLR